MKNIKADIPLFSFFNFLSPNLLIFYEFLIDLGQKEWLNSIEFK